MPGLKQDQLQKTPLKRAHTLAPAVVGCLMLGASLLPWLNDPLGASRSAWQLPIDIGWQFHLGVLNYGLLCTCCALLAFFVAYARWKPFRGIVHLEREHLLLGVLCMAPVLLFLLQYLFVDVQGIDTLAQHERQLLLVQRHFGYSVADQIIRLSAFNVSSATMGGRLALLVNLVSMGIILPCISASIMIESRRFSPTQPECRRGEGGEAGKGGPLWSPRLPRVPARGPLSSPGCGSPTMDESPPQACPRYTARGVPLRWACLLLGLIALVVVLGRAPAAMACEYQAKELLAAGDYAPALQWLDTARVLNPSLDQVSYYHQQRGEALYFLHPGEQSDDSRIYLAFTYREQGDYLAAYQELVGLDAGNVVATLAVARAADSSPSWVKDEVSITLERLAEFTQQPGAPPIEKEDNDLSALPWLQLLSQVDASNVYSAYLVGRFQYDLHDYSACTAQMTIVLQLSHDTDVQSSAYTYMGLSMAGQGDAVDARRLLLKAVALDPNYHNNTAREELSGLH